MYTKNQLKVINSEEKFIYVQAPPGTGKSSTMFGCLKNDKRKSLVLCFNSSIRNELMEKAREKEVFNATFHTFHSLAFDFFKRTDVIKSFKEREMVDNFDYFEMKKLLKIMKKKELEDSELVKLKTLFLNFLSSDMQISELESGHYGLLIKEMFIFIKDNEECFIFHSFYIKLFQLIKYKNKEIEVVYCDESQDANACYNNIVLNLNAKKFYFFGDNQQKIYSFNGAEGMTKQNYFLDVSFRLGSECANICNKLISSALKTDEYDFLGVNVNQEIVENFGQFEKYTIICRKNKTILKLIEKARVEKKFCYIVGGKQSLGFSRLKEILKCFDKQGFYLYKGEKIKNCNDLIALSQKTKENTLKTMASLINTLGLNTYSKIEALERVVVDDKIMADIILTTVHKSKGLEFENVLLADDFETIEKIINDKDETYVFYVALSRCYGKLKLNEETKKFCENNKVVVEEYEKEIL